jgi:hypothetical protein
LLAIVPLPVLERYAAEALSGEAGDPGLGLQDIVNELGSRLGYEVEAGLYRGRRGESVCGETQDGLTAIYYAPSQAYRESNYVKFWFGLHDHQVDFLSKHSEAFVACACVGAGMLFVPWSEFSKHPGHMLESSKDKRHWRHIVFRLSKDGKLKLWLRSDAPQPQIDFSKWFETQ